MRYTVAGLGNPGNEYEGTRHNTGRSIVLACTTLWRLPDFSLDKKTKALQTSGKVGKTAIDLVLPETYMNKSGSSLGSVIKTKKAAETLVIVHDELDLPLGRFKISFGKNAGGHKGVESVIKAVKTKNFIRIRVGISPSTPSGKLKKPHGEDISDFVIAKFRKPEEEVFKKVARKLCESLEMIFADGKEKAMGKFNR